MGLFGPSPEKIRRAAAAEFPQADWQINVDWSSGSKLHQLRGALAEGRTEAEAMQYARNVWISLTTKYRMNPDDGRDGLLDVSISSPGVAAQSTGTAG